MKYLSFLTIITAAVVVIFFIFYPSKFKKPPVQSQTDKGGSPTKDILITQQPTESQRESVSKGATPTIPLLLPNGFTIHVFASGLGNPRVLEFSPGGILLVSDPTANRVFALPDTNHDGVADSERIIISGENHVHGLAFYQDKLYIADVDRVVRYNWDEATLSATKDKVLFALPENSDHNNRSIVFSASGEMFISLGSTCNVCREASIVGGSVLVSDANGTGPQVFATGLRDAGFLSVNPRSGELWGTEMGRDYLGDNLPPDEINIIQHGKNYGWPNCYGDQIHDISFDKSSNDPCATTESPIYQIPAHSAPLGLLFINSPQFPDEWQGDLLVAYHGSWNRSVATGFKIVHLKVNGNSIINSEDFLTGFLQGATNQSAFGRPVDMVFDQSGNLYVSDDRAGVVYIIQKQN